MSNESNVKQESAIGRSWEEFEKDIYTAEEIRESVEEYAKTITDKDIKDYRYFLECGEKWGWD